MDVGRAGTNGGRKMTRGLRAPAVPREGRRFVCLLYTLSSLTWCGWHGLLLWAAALLLLLLLRIVVVEIPRRVIPLEQPKDVVRGRSHLCLARARS